MSLYLYGIIERSDPTDLAPTDLGPIGFGGGKVEALPGGPLAVLVGPAPQMDLGESPLRHLPQGELVKLLLAHQQTLELVMKHSFVLPFKFGTILADQDEANRILKEDGAFLHKLIDQMRECVEIDVVATWQVPEILQEISEQDPEIVAIKHKMAGKNQAQSAVEGEAPSGFARGGGDASPLEDRALVGMLLAKALKRRAEDWRHTITETLRKHAAADVEHNLLNDTMILNNSFLIRQGKKQEFFSSLEEMDVLFQKKLHFKCVGPLPPYSFATVTLKRFDPLQMEEAARVLQLNGRASLSEVKRIYRDFSRKLHPDTNPGIPLGDFERLHQAYELVVDYCRDRPRSLSREAVVSCLRLELVGTQGGLHRAA